MLGSPRAGSIWPGRRNSPGCATGSAPNGASCPGSGSRRTIGFEGPHGPATLADLFAGRSQLIVYHFMLGPGWDEGCPSCSLLADHFDGALPHLNARDVSLVVVSRAPLPEIQKFQRRMGWRTPWVSSYGSDFNFDFHVSFTKEELARGKVDYNYGLAEGYDELPGLSVFYKDEHDAIGEGWRSVPTARAAPQEPQDASHTK